MTWPLTREEVVDLRRRRFRCCDCGRTLPNYPEARDGHAARCFPCGYKWRYGTLPAGWRSAS